MGVIHLFGHPAADFDAQALIAAVNDAKGRGTQVVTVAMLGHKADMAFMAVSADMRELRALQTAIQNAGVDHGVSAHSQHKEFAVTGEVHR